MNTIRRPLLLHVALGLLLSASLPVAVHAQSKKALMKRHREAKAELGTERAKWGSLADLCIEYKQLDALPRIVWGAVPMERLGDRLLVIEGDSAKLVLFDLDGDQVPDEYSLHDFQDNPVPQEFGFLYDADANGRIDRIIYNAGMMMDMTGNIKALLYHWADLNGDGRVDARTNPYFVLGNDSLPNFDRVLLMRDTDFDGRVNTAEVLDLKQAAALPLPLNTGTWTYRTVFGEEQVSSEDEQAFRMESMILQAVLSFTGNGTPPAP